MSGDIRFLIQTKTWSRSRSRITKMDGTSVFFCDLVVYILVRNCTFCLEIEINVLN